MKSCKLNITIVWDSNFEMMNLQLTSNPLHFPLSFFSTCINSWVSSLYMQNFSCIVMRHYDIHHYDFFLVFLEKGDLIQKSTTGTLKLSIQSIPSQIIIIIQKIWNNIRVRSIWQRRRRVYNMVNYYIFIFNTLGVFDLSIFYFSSILKEQKCAQ